MPRIHPVPTGNASEKSTRILDAVANKMGKAPNLLLTLAHSPAALRFYVGQIESLGAGALGNQLPEQIALVVAGFNHCDYCASAHTEAGRARGLEAQELHANLSGLSGSGKTQAALHFAREILMTRGHVTEGSVQVMRDVGYTEAEIVEVIAHVGMNNFTNYFNHIAATEIDFPLVTTA